MALGGTDFERHAVVAPVARTPARRDPRQHLLHNARPASLAQPRCREVGPNNGARDPSRSSRAKVDDCLISIPRLRPQRLRCHLADDEQVLCEAGPLSGVWRALRCALANPRAAPGRRHTDNAGQTWQRPGRTDRAGPFDERNAPAIPARRGACAHIESRSPAIRADSPKHDLSITSLRARRHLVAPSARRVVHLAAPVTARDSSRFATFGAMSRRQPTAPTD